MHSVDGALILATTRTVVADDERSQTWKNVVLCYSVTLTTAQHFPALHWIQLDVGCDWKGYWMPSHLTDNVFNTVNNWITPFSFSYSEKSVAENSRMNGGSLTSVTVSFIKALRA